MLQPVAALLMPAQLLSGLDPLMQLVSAARLHAAERLPQAAGIRCSGDGQQVAGPVAMGQRLASANLGVAACSKLQMAALQQAV